MKHSKVAIVLGLVFVLAFVSACQTLTGRSAGRYLDDKTISAHVKAKLFGDKAANLTRIGVTTVNGVVNLDGVVDSFNDKARAEELASKVDGVQHVNNQIQVRAPAASPR
jgi:hyperosmotically inducible periplasmic protein